MSATIHGGSELYSLVEQPGSSFTTTRAGFDTGRRTFKCWQSVAGTLFVKLHTGDPGSAGASNASGVTTRSAATFGSAASGGDGPMVLKTGTKEGKEYRGWVCPTPKSGHPAKWMRIGSDGQRTGYRACPYYA